MNSQHKLKRLFCTKTPVLRCLIYVQIQIRLRFGMTNSINTHLVLKVTNTPHESLDLNKNWLNWTNQISYSKKRLFQKGTIIWLNKEMYRIARKNVIWIVVAPINLKPKSREIYNLHIFICWIFVSYSLLTYIVILIRWFLNLIGLEQCPSLPKKNKTVEIYYF